MEHKSGSTGKKFRNTRNQERHLPKDFLHPLILVLCIITLILIVRKTKIGMYSKAANKSSNACYPCMAINIMVKMNRKPIPSLIRCILSALEVYRMDFELKKM